MVEVCLEVSLEVSLVLASERAPNIRYSGRRNMLSLCVLDCLMAFCLHSDWVLCRMIRVHKHVATMNTLNQS